MGTYSDYGVLVSTYVITHGHNLEHVEIILSTIQVHVVTDWVFITHLNRSLDHKNHWLKGRRSQ